MVYNVNDHVAVASSLLREIDSTLIDIDRGEEMLLRLQVMPADAKVSSEVLEFIRDYSPMCDKVSVEGVSEAFAVIGKILDGLKRGLVKLYSILAEVFRILFDSQYRSRKVFLDMQRNLVAVASDTEAVKEFESIACTVISQEDAMTSIGKNQQLINLIKLVSMCDDKSGVDSLLNDFHSIGGVDWSSNKLVDTLTEVTAQRFVDFHSAGWNIDGISKAIAKHISTLSGIEVLKETKTKLDRDIKQLTAAVDTAMISNPSSDAVATLQHQCAIKILIVRVISSAIDILIKRSSAISTVIRAINGELVRVAEARKAAR